MERKVKELLSGNWENHIFPFFWQHGEEEAVLRDYMRAIDGCGCKAVCVESRPHPDFCGEKWWQDMDVILDEARKRGMKVWILDDSHFPTGYANGALKTAAPELHRQSVCAGKAEFSGEAGEVDIDVPGMFPPPFQPSGIEAYIIGSLLKDAPHFEDDQVLAVTAVNHDTGETVILPVPAPGEKLSWQKPEGSWEVWVVGLSRNFGPHREYMNMMDPASCRLLLDAVYEPHWAHYREDFGKTIAGFFSDEPELGNGHLYFMENVLGTDQDLPFAATLPALLKEGLGENWANELYLLWDGRGEAGHTARVRYAYMDAVTRQVREAFSHQVGDWCHAHGVEYIGHVIEDNNAHARTGSSLGHYFRGLDGQDMAGIDDIGGQVYPQGEEEPKYNDLRQPRDGEFYHYMLGTLAASAAAIEPKKKGRAMCEIFGNYGWSEGLRLEKYLADHFLVRGINHFVPHAFTPAPFPDPDCPPHFYAHGNNPQYRHFGKLMDYMNRVSTLTSGGHRVSSVAVLYHGEAEWAGKAQLTQKPARVLAEAQIGHDCIPSDVFAQPEHYGTVLGRRLRVNTQEYQALVVPYAQFVTKEAADAFSTLQKAGFPVIFLEGLPEGICNPEGSKAGEMAEAGAAEKGGQTGENGKACVTGRPEGQEISETEKLISDLAECKVLPLEELVPYLRQMGLEEVRIQPENSYVRVLHYEEIRCAETASQRNSGNFASGGGASAVSAETIGQKSSGELTSGADASSSHRYLLVNEAAEAYEGKIFLPAGLPSGLPAVGTCYAYDAFANRVYPVEPEDGGISLRLEPLHSLFLIFDGDYLEEKDAAFMSEPVVCEGTPLALAPWTRSICESLEYPAFREAREIALPDALAEEKPEFSGFVRYESSFRTSGANSRITLEISDAQEGVEVFVNGKSAGIQIVPPFRYDLTELAQEGENRLAIEVATTLERKCYELRKDDPMMKLRGLAKPKCGSGLVGTVTVRQRPGRSVAANSQEA